IVGVSSAHRGGHPGGAGLSSRGQLVLDVVRPELRRVKEVVEFHAELQVHTFGDLEVLVEGKVGIGNPRSFARTYRGIPKGTELIVVERERGGVKPLVLRPTVTSAILQHTVRFLIVVVTRSLKTASRPGGATVQSENRETGTAGVLEDSSHFPATKG